jgi:hypothetical protein
MYEEGISPRQFRKYDTTLLVQRKRAELGLDDLEDAPQILKGQDEKGETDERLEYARSHLDA